MDSKASDADAIGIYPVQHLWAVLDGWAREAARPSRRIDLRPEAVTRAVCLDEGIHCRLPAPAAFLPLF